MIKIWQELVERYQQKWQGWNQWKYLGLSAATMLLALLISFLIDVPFVSRCITSPDSFDVDKCEILGKSAWDWLNLLIAPALLAIGGVIAERYFKHRDKDQERHTALKEYFAQMTQLTLESTWPKIGDGKNEENYQIIAVARARTLATLQELDGDRKRALVIFLIESDALRIISFDSADLSDAKLYGLRLRNVDLKGADLSKSDLSGADLSGADLKYANLKLANLTVVHCDELPNKETNFSNADFTSAKLSYGRLHNAKMTGVNFENANLSEADLSNTDLTFAQFKRAILKNTNFENAILLNANLQKAKGLNLMQFMGELPPLLCGTILPDHIDSLSRLCNRDCNQNFKNYLRERYPDKSVEIHERLIDRFRQEKNLRSE